MSTFSYSDRPAEIDQLNRTELVQSLARVINSISATETITIGIYGAWGSGKTTMMNLLRKELEEPHDHDTTTQTKPTPQATIFFEAWHYARQEDALWRALLLHIVEELRNANRIKKEKDAEQKVLTGLLKIAIPDQRSQLIADPPKREAKKEDQSLENVINHDFEQDLDDLEASLYRSVERTEVGTPEVQLAKLIQVGISIGVGFAANMVGIPSQELLKKVFEGASNKAGETVVTELGGLVRRKQQKIYVDQVRSLEQFQKKLRTLVQQYMIANKTHLVVFIDDLDRCLPEQAVGVLEAIKVFLDIPGCIFVLGIDHSIIQDGIRVHYKEFALDHGRNSVAVNISNDATIAQPARSQGIPIPIDEHNYLEKIIQLPVNIPPINPADLKEFINWRLDQIPSLPDDSREVIRDIFEGGIEPNPRKLKRTLHLFHFLWELHKNHPILLAKLVAIEVNFPQEYKIICDDPQFLLECEKSLYSEAGMISAEQISPKYAYILRNKDRKDDIRFETTTKEHIDFSTWFRQFFGGSYGINK